MIKLSLKRAKISKRMATYKKRKEKYSRNIKELNRQIKLDARELRRIDNRTDRVRKLGQQVKIFTNTSFKNAKYDDRFDVKLAKGFFFKYGVENGMQANDLMNYLGVTRNYISTEYRKWVTKIIISNPEIKQRWENFKQYIENP